MFGCVLDAELKTAVAPTFKKTKATQNFTSRYDVRHFYPNQNRVAPCHDISGAQVWFALHMCQNRHRESRWRWCYSLLKLVDILFRVRRRTIHWQLQEAPWSRQHRQEHGGKKACRDNDVKIQCGNIIWRRAAAEKFYIFCQQSCRRSVL